MTERHLKLLIQEKRELTSTYNKIKAKCDKMTRQHSQFLTKNKRSLGSKIKTIDKAYSSMQDQLLEQK